MATLKTGQKAPDFKLLDQDGKPRSLKDLYSKSKYLILYFYPKDLTPGCTIEAQEFSKGIAAFKKLKASIVGVSGGDSDSKKKFCNKHKLKITLLADDDFGVSKKFGAYGKKHFMGRIFNGIYRKTFIINSKGQVSHIYPEVKAEGHAQEVQILLAAMDGAKTAKKPVSPSKTKVTKSKKK